MRNDAHPGGLAKIALMLSFCTVVAGCAKYSEAVNLMGIQRPLNQYLYNDYTTVSQMMKTKNLHSRARLFHRKAMAARNNENVLPEAPSNYANLARSKIVEYAEFRNRLLLERGFVAPSCTPAQLASAQVQLDCHIILDGLFSASTAVNEICSPEKLTVKC